MNIAENPTKIIPIRASSLSDLFDCPARWEAKNLLNKRMPAGARTRLGTAIHEAVTQWDHMHLIGEDMFAQNKPWIEGAIQRIQAAKTQDDINEVYTDPAYEELSDQGKQRLDLAAQQREAELFG